MTCVVGLDTSITGTGIAVVRTSIAGEALAYTDVVRSTGRSSDPLPVRSRRMLTMRNRIMAGLPDGHVDLLVIEGLSFGHNQPGQDRLHHLWWLVIGALGQSRPDTHITVVPPSTAKKAVTDKGNADKRTMRAAVERWWPQTGIDDDNAADALALASLGAVHMRVPVPFPIQEHTRLALAKLDLPERPSR